MRRRRACRLISGRIVAHPDSEAGRRFGRPQPSCASERRGPVCRIIVEGMVFGMATTKLTITLQNDQLEEIRTLVAAGQAGSVSAFVKHAVGAALLDAAGWREMLEDALQQTGGPLSKKERAWADALLSPQRQKRSSKKGKAA